jgi:serine protease Do
MPRSDLGLRIAFIQREQAQQLSALGLSMQPGAVVWEVENDRPAGKAGLQVGDVLVEIAGGKIVTEDDLRQSIRKIGSGKTRWSFRRENEIKNVVIDCPNCKAQ